MGAVAGFAQLEHSPGARHTTPTTGHGAIRDVEHIIVLMQKNRPFDHHFGTLKGVRGFNDPRAVNIHLPLQSGNGYQRPLRSSYSQPARPTWRAAIESLPIQGTLGGPGRRYVCSFLPFRVDPTAGFRATTSISPAYFPRNGAIAEGNTHKAWNRGRYDSWASVNGPVTMSYMTRADIPYHCALADAFTVGDAYHCSRPGTDQPQSNLPLVGLHRQPGWIGSGRH